MYWGSLTLTFTIYMFISCKYSDATSNPPTIKFDKSYANIPENSKRGTLIAHVTAVGRNGKPVLIMSANKETQDLVDIRNTSSISTTTIVEITLKGTLDRESLPERTVIVKACDCLGCKGCVYATKAFTIFVSDVNDEAPVFQNLPYQCEIAENANIHSSINASIKAVDRDNGLSGQVHYYLTPSGQAKALYQGAFSIDKNTGILTTQRGLDYETLSFYQYTVTAADFYNKSSAADVLIKIKDVQDKPPFFQGLPYLRNIPETSNVSALGTILKVKASDGDTGVPNKIEYQFENGSRCGDLFHIDAKDGNVTAIRSLDRDDGILKELGGYCLIHVTALEVGDNIDQFGKNTSTTLITINIEDVNDNKPEFESHHYDAQVLEDTASIPITVNGTGIKVHDFDQGKNSHINITVLLQNGTVCNFLEATPSEIYGTGDILIRLSKTFRFDYETMKNISIKVVATEMDTSEQWSATCDIDISIIDVNDNDPIFEQDEYLFNVTEDAVNNTQIGQINATDEDSGKFGTGRFMLRGGNGKFRIDPSTGVLYTNGDNTTLDREIKDIYYLTVIAEDGGNRRTTVSIQINLLDMNDNVPKFERAVYTTALKENALNFSYGELFVRATDNDEGDTVNSCITYGIASVTPKLVQDNFKANTSSGKISIINAVDYEALSKLKFYKISLLITAADYGSPSLTGTTTLYITVIDENDNNPEFTANITDAEIQEDSSPGDNVTSVLAIDGDAAKPNNALSYFIQKGSDKFRIDSSTGYIKVELNAKFDRETTPSYNLTIIAIDKGDPQLTGTTFVTVDIKDVNDEKPKFIKSNFDAKIKENLKNGAPVVTCEARDEDLDSDLLYIIEEIEAFNNENKEINASLVQSYFRINGSSGSVYVSSELDAETATEIILTLNVTDVKGILNTPQYDTAKLTITLEDINDNTPFFDNKASLFANLSESTVKGAIMTTVHATDHDITSENRKITYSLHVNPFNAFQIDSQEVETTTTTPPVPQRSDISCNADTIDTFVPISMLPSGAPLTWRDPSCKVTSNGTHMISSIGHNQCGTTVTITKDTVEFENELTAQISNHSANTLIDFGENSYVIPVKCIYPRTETPMTSYVPLQQHVRFYEKRYGHFDVDITQYDSDKFSSAIQSLGVPRKVALNTEIFVEVKMNDQFNNGLGIHVDKCIATPSPSPSDSTYYNLLTDGCPASQHVQLYNAPANKVRFGVRAFQFTTHNSSIVYIHCQTSMCEVGTPYCVSNCVTAGRRKRDVAPDQKSHLVSTGPFVFVADEQDNPIRMSTIVASVSLFVAVVACVAAVMGWTRKKTHTSTKEEGLL